MYFVDILLREIATEGLEGITISKLWEHLSYKESQFPWSLDDNSKQFLWSTILSIDSIDVYVNPEPVLSCGPYDRREWLVDDDRGVYYEVPAEYMPPEIFPVATSSEVGSCRFYDRRVKVTEQVRQSEELHSLKNVLAKWNDKLVLVASQDRRADLLLGNHCSINDLSIGCYLILEAVAKYRYNGVPTTNCEGLVHAGVSPSTVWYARQKLESLGLIHVQLHMTKVGKLPMSTGPLLNHWRYNRNFPFPHGVIIEKLTRFLNSQPKKACPAVKVRGVLGLNIRGYKRAIKFGLRHQFVTIRNWNFKDYCSFALDKPCEELTEEDMDAVRAKVYGKKPAHVAVVSVIFLKKMFSAETWLADMDKANKRKTGCNGADDAEGSAEEDEVAEAETEALTPFTGLKMECSAISDITTAECSLSATDQSGPSEECGASETVEKSKPPVLLFRNYKRSLAAFPCLNTEESLTVQIARRFLPHEITCAQLFKDTPFEYFAARRVIVGLEHLRVLKIIKRSMDATFVIYRQLYTDEERIASLDGTSQGNGDGVRQLNLQTQRQKRRQFILDYLSEHRVITSVVQLRHLLWEHEAEQGLKIRMDRKSLTRILDELVKEKRVVVKSVKAIVGDLRFLCHPDVGPDDPAIKAALHSLELGVLKRKVKLESCEFEPTAQTIPPISSEVMATVQVKNRGCCPRSRRRLLLHQYLYYVTHVLPPDASPIIPATENRPAVYCDDNSWRRYVGPVAHPDDLPPGWFNVTDVLRSMPCGLYMHLLSSSQLPRIVCRWLGLNEYLCNLTSEEIASIDEELKPSRDDTPLSEMLLFPLNAVSPPGGPHGRVMNWMLSERRLRTMTSYIQELGLQGLITTQEKKVPRLRNLVHLYLHKNATLLDTRAAGPAYRVLTDITHCRLHRFQFNTMEDVSSYWQTCELICQYTRLGHRSVKDELDIQMVPCVIPKYSGDPASVVDDGQLPVISWPKELVKKFKCVNDDGVELRPCGACGFNPADFTHNARNWRAAQFLHKPKTRKKRRRGRARSSSGSSESSDESDNRNPPRYSSYRLPFEKRRKQKCAEECLWPWCDRLFPDSDYPPSFDPHPKVYEDEINSSSPPTAELKKPSGIGCRIGLRSRGVDAEARVLPDNNSSATKTDIDPSIPKDTSRDILEVEPKTRLQRKHAYRNLRHLRRSRTTKKKNEQRPRREVQKNPARAVSDKRMPRRMWSNNEDQLLVICRVASILITGVCPRESLCVSYVVVRDIIRQYIPKASQYTTALACARRLKFILFTKRTETTALRILVTRVSSRPDMQKKYNFGRARWGEIVKNSPEKARRIFCEAVDSIITDFAPRLQRWKRKKSNIKNSANILSTEPCPSTSPHVLTGSSQSESDLLNKDSLHPIWIQGSRKEVEQKFTFITIKESPDRPTVEDVGTSRAAIVVYTLYIYALSSFRIFAEPVPYNGPIFSRVTRQYPRVQLSQTLRMLFSNHLMTYAKSGSMAETEFRIFGSMRIKLSSRFLQWAFFEYNTQIKHILEAESVASSVKKRMDAIIWRSKEKPSSVSVEAQTLIEHSFDGVTTGGLVAFVLELMLFDKSVDFLMSFNISDIAFIGDRSLASALDRYHEKLAEAMLSASGPSTTLGRRHSDTGSSGEDTPVEAVRPSEPLVNRKFFYEAQQIAEGLANPDLSSNFCRRSRWYDHHLSFSGGKLTVRFRKLKESRKTVEHKDSFVSVESWLGGIHSRVKPTLDHAVRPRIISPVEMMYKSNAREPSEQSGLLGSVEQAVFQGRFSGRTTSELKVQFGDTHELATVLQDLVITEKIYWLGTSISRFVHCKYIRLWLIHLKPKMAKTVTSRPTANDTVDMDASWDSPSEPRPKRARLTCSGRSNTATDLVDHSRRPSMNTRSTASTVLRRADSTRGIPSNNSEEGFFFPECWCAEDGRIKPQMFCNCLQALVVILAQNSGITLERFALKHQEMAGQQTVRRLLFWLKEMGAVKLFRMKKLSKPALFSPPPVYSLSDDVILASADELVLIAQPDCISTVGTFCRDYLSASGKNDVT